MKNEIYSAIIACRDNDYFCYVFSAGGEEEKVKKEVEGIDGLEGRLIPPRLMIEIYFSKEQKDIDNLEEKKETAIAKMQSDYVGLIARDLP